MMRLRLLLASLQLFEGTRQVWSFSLLHHHHHPTKAAVWSIPSSSSSFVRVRRAPTTRSTTTTTTTHLKDSSSSFLSEDDATIYQLLKARQSELQDQERKVRSNWQNANFTGGVVMTVPDWVRRVTVLDYPIVVCGSSSESIFIMNVETSMITVIGRSNKMAEKEEKPPLEKESVEETLRCLYGSYDGGGTVAIAASGTLIAVSGRSGGVDLYRFEQRRRSASSDGTTTTKAEVIGQGSLHSLDGKLVTALQMSDDMLYVGADDGIVRAFSIDDDSGEEDLLPPLSLRSPAQEWKVSGGCAVLSLSVHSTDPLHCIVVTSVGGSVDLFPLERPSKQQHSFYPPFDSRRSLKAFARSATIVSLEEKTKNEDRGDNDDDSSSPSAYAIVCGGNDGSIYMQRLTIKQDECTINWDQPFSPNHPLKALTPNHNGPVMVMTSPHPNLLVTGGQDGTVRVWDLTTCFDNSNNRRTTTTTTQILYVMQGFKVWLGSLWTDGLRLITDGADNAIMLFDFSRSEK